MTKVRLQCVLAVLAVLLGSLTIGLHVAARHSGFAVLSDQSQKNDWLITQEITGKAIDFSPMTRIFGQCLACVMSGHIPGPLTINVHITISYPAVAVVDDSFLVSVAYAIIVNDK